MTSVNGGRYPVGFVALAYSEQGSMCSKDGVQEIAITGVERSELAKDKISISVSGEEVPFLFVRGEERFRIVLRDAL